MSGGRDKLVVALAPSFGGEEVIVPTAQAVGVLSTHCRARFIDCAPAGFGVEKPADFFEDVVFLVSKNGTIDGGLCVAPLRLLV